MKIGIFYIATSVYKEYFKKYFFNTLTNLFPNDMKEIIIVTDGGLEDYKQKEPKNCRLHFEDIIDFPYPIINLCKFQIVKKYADKYDIDMILYFDADSLIFEKPYDFWESLKTKVSENKTRMILSYHPHYLYNPNFLFGRDYFFPVREGSCSNISPNIIMEKKCYMMTSFFMCHKIALADYTQKIYEMAKLNLRNLRWMPELSDETYLNVINLREGQSVLLDNYITINPYIYGHYPEKANGDIWKNNFPDKPSIFINQKFDIELKDKKR